MARAPERSCYVLELSVQPGGSRWAELHVYSKLEHIRAWLEVFCRNEFMNAYHAIWYGATLGVWVVQKGQVVKFVDAHPHIRARLGDELSVPLTDKDGCLALVRKHRPKDEEDDEEDDEVDNDWHDADIDTLDQMKLELDWISISAQLPPLEKPILRPGQETKIKQMKMKKSERVDTYLDSGTISFGSMEHENGSDLEPPFDVHEGEAVEEDED